MTGEDRARLDTSGSGQVQWDEPRQRKSRTALICIGLSLLIAGIGWMVFGLV